MIEKRPAVFDHVGKDPLHSLFSESRIGPRQDRGESRHLPKDLLAQSDKLSVLIFHFYHMKRGSSGESVGNLRVSALGLSEETVKLAAGGIERTLLVFPAVVDQRAAVLMDHVADKLFRGALS